MGQLLNRQTSIVGLSQLLRSLNLKDTTLDSLLTKCGLSTATMADPQSELSLSQEFQLIRLLIKEVNDPLLGLKAGQCYRLNAFGPLGLAATSANNFHSAITLFVKYIDLTYTLFNVTFTTEGKWAYLEFSENEPLGDLLPYYRDRDLSFCVTAIRDVNPEAYGSINKRIELNCPPPENADAYEAFFQCPVRFNQKHNRTVFEVSALDMTLPQANDLNLKLLEAKCKKRLDQLDKISGFKGQVVAEIVAQSDQRIPTLEEIAGHLSTTSRTVRRKLESEGSSFQQLLNYHLQQKASHLLENSQLSIEMIGHQIGYSEPAAFIHAFKRWTGKTPHQYRQSHKP